MGSPRVDKGRGAIEHSETPRGSVDKALSILTEVAGSSNGLTLSVIARKAGLSPATCHRLLRTLARRQLVLRDSSGQYRQGIGLLKLAAAVTSSSVLGEPTEAILRSLRDRWQECFYLSVLVDGEVVCIRSVATTDPNRMGVYVPLGRRFPAYAAAAAKAILAFGPPELAKRALANEELVPFTRFTNTSRDKVLSELQLTRQRGHAVCDQEMEIGVIAFAVPVVVGNGDVVWSLGVIGPRERLVGSVHEGLIREMMASASLLGTSTSAVPAGQRVRLAEPSHRANEASAQTDELLAEVGSGQGTNGTG